LVWVASAHFDAKVHPLPLVLYRAPCQWSRQVCLPSRLPKRKRRRPRGRLPSRCRRSGQPTRRRATRLHCRRRKCTTPAGADGLARPLPQSPVQWLRPCRLCRALDMAPSLLDGRNVTQRDSSHPTFGPHR
jgi:hypothetical protein